MISYPDTAQQAAFMMKSFLLINKIPTVTRNNNIWAYNRYFDLCKPTILLVSGHSNSSDATAHFFSMDHPKCTYNGDDDHTSACLATLTATFIHFFDRMDLPFNLCLAAIDIADNEPEVVLDTLLKELVPISFIIEGSSTGMDVVVPEQKHLLLDCAIHHDLGCSIDSISHRATVYSIFKDIQWFSSFNFPLKKNNSMPVIMDVSEVDTKFVREMNMVEFRFTVNIRLNNCYTMDQLLSIIKANVKCKITPHYNSLDFGDMWSFHPLIKVAMALGTKVRIAYSDNYKGHSAISSMRMGPDEPSRVLHNGASSEGYKKAVDVYVKLLEGLAPYLMEGTIDKEKGALIS